MTSFLIVRLEWKFSRTCSSSDASDLDSDARDAIVSCKVFNLSSKVGRRMSSEPPFATCMCHIWLVETLWGANTLKKGQLRCSRTCHMCMSVHINRNFRKKPIATFWEKWNFQFPTELQPTNLWQFRQYHHKHNNQQWTIWLPRIRLLCQNLI